MTFSAEELARYARHLSLTDFGPAAQLKLKGASVLVIGAGGLGCPALLYLAAAGVGVVGVMDFDKVEIHNLHRQILYDESDVGKSKADSAVAHLMKKNSFVRFVPFGK